MSGRALPSELKFTFQMKDEFDGVNPKHLVKRETQQGYNSGGGSYIGTCSHYCNEDDTCTTQYISADGTLSFYSGCEDGNGCYNSNEYCSDCIDVWPDYDTCGATYEEDVYA